MKVGVNQANADTLTQIGVQAQQGQYRDRGDKELRALGTATFPLEAMPEGLRSIAAHLQETIGFPVDYTCAAMLFAVSVATGTSVLISPKRGWAEPCVLWLALVGRPGANKTHPLSWAVRPLYRRDGEHARKYANLHKAYSDALKREKAGEKVDVPDEPTHLQHLIGDTTPEALVEALDSNPRGLGLHRDELAGWVMDFGRYSSGGDAERFLSMWSLQPVNVNRVKSKRPSRAERPFVSVAGTIQPGVLGKLGGDGRGDNGFIDRILFAYPQGDAMPAWSERDPNPDTTQLWDYVLGRLLDLPAPLDEKEPTELNFSASAKALWVHHHDKLRAEVDAFNKEGDEACAGYRTKLVVYTLRFALLHTMARWAAGTNPEPPKEVDEVSLDAAIALADYFASTADRVLRTLHEGSSEDRLKGDSLKLFEKLGAGFEASEAVANAKIMGIAERTAKRWLNKWTRAGLLRREKRGSYTKCFE